MNMYNCMSGLAGITAITKQLHSEQLSLYQTVQDGFNSIYTQFHAVMLILIYGIIVRLIVKDHPN